MIDRGLLDVGSVMTEQAVVQRNTQAADSVGGKSKKNWQPLATVTCFHWFGQGKAVTRVGGSHARPEQTVDLDTGGMIMPEGVDITARDRITEIQDESGSTIVAGPLEVLAVAPFEGLTELSFRRIT